MKRLFTLMLTFAVASITAIVFAGTPVSVSDLPKAITTFLSKHFPNDKVWEAEKDREYLGFEYEVSLESGAEIDFKTNLEWKEVKAGRGKSVPASLIPSAVSKFVASNHPDLTIVEISRKRGGYEIELSNGLEIKLTKEGKVIAYD